MRQNKIVTVGARSGIIKEQIVDAPEEEQTPKAREMAASFAVAAARFAASGFKLSDHADERVAVCESCEHMGTDGNWKNRCKLCGCFMKVKAKIKSETCPDRRWPK